jgi:predicted deacylase
MRYLRMLPGAPDFVAKPIWITSVATVNSDQAGIFYPLVERGAAVAKDAPLGYVTDFFGQKIFEARAPVAGEVLYICSVPSMTKGGTIANIGVTE